MDTTAIGDVTVGVLIALGIFFMVQGMVIDVYLLFLAAFITIGFILQARDKRRARQATVEQALGEAEAILRGKG